MEKMQIGAKPFVYPLPTTLVGTNVDGRPTFMAVAYCNMLSSKPPVLAVASSRGHYTNAGIRENRTFSVNIPSADMVAVTDYCGVVSGHKVDKSRLFDTFYGSLGTAPMICECPINMECRVVQIIESGNNEVFIGEIVESYAEERYLTDGLPDVKKIDPILYTVNDRNYWKVGEHLAKAHSIGKGFKKPG